MESQGSTSTIVPGKIAVVARDLTQQTPSGPGTFLHRRRGFAPHIGAIMRIASQNGAKLVLFSPWSHPSHLGPLRRTTLFPRNTHHEAVVLGVGDPGNERVEVHVRSRRLAVKVSQCFATTSDGEKEKEAFLADRSLRTFGPTFLIVCGETNIIRTNRKSTAIADDHGFLRWMRAAGISLVLNPVHDYMRRFEMVRKRREISRAGHTLVSVWNRGWKKGTESRVPWAAYRNGSVVTNKIQEIDGIASQRGIRIGLLDLK